MQQDAPHLDVFLDGTRIPLFGRSFGLCHSRLTWTVKGKYPQKKKSFSDTWEKKDVDLGWLWIQLAWFGACLDTPPCLSARLHWSPRAKILSPSAVRQQRFAGSWSLFIVTQLMRHDKNCPRLFPSMLPKASKYFIIFQRICSAFLSTNGRQSQPPRKTNRQVPLLHWPSRRWRRRPHHLPWDSIVVQQFLGPSLILCSTKKYMYIYIYIYIYMYIYIYTYIYTYICGFPPWKTSLIDLTDPICSMAGSEKTSTRKT